MFWKNEFDYNKIIMSIKNNLIIVTRSVKQCKTQKKITNKRSLFSKFSKIKLCEGLLFLILFITNPNSNDS